MEVTTKNFKETLKILEKDVKECSFLAIDAEFTGLLGDKKPGFYDTPEERYQKLLNIVDKYTLIQYGVSCFFYDPQLKKYTYKSYNFYVFPHSWGSYGYDPVFSCQAASLKFLSDQGFNFNKLLSEGIPHLHSQEEEHIRARLSEKQNEQIRLNLSSPNSNDKEARQIPADQQTFVNNVLKQVEEFVATEENSIQLSPCTAYQRRLLYETLKNKYPSGLDMQTQVTENNNRYIVITKASREETETRLRLKHQAEIQEVEDAVGFSKVIKLVSRSGKFVIGHNMMLDLMHTINSYVYPLPRDYNDFKDLVKCTFPQILDTKVLAHSELFKDSISSTGLNNLVNLIQAKPFSLPVIEAADGFERYNLSERLLHEAGYDSLLTGVCLIGMCEYLGKSSEKSIIPGFKFVQPYTNKCFLMTSQDIPYFNLDGEDLIPERNHVFHISFPREWTQLDLRELFFPFGQIYVSWLDDTSAFIALKNTDQIPRVVKHLIKEKSIGSIYTVRSYTDYKRRQSLKLEKRHSTFPYSDVNLPPKRKRSIESTENWTNRSIDPIPEEEEEEEHSDTEPEAKKPRNDNEAVEKQSKLFEEASDW